MPPSRSMERRNSMGLPFANTYGKGMEIMPNRSPLMVYHCAGKENPADFLSRGLNTYCLVSNSRWWTGAEFCPILNFPKTFHQVVPELDYLTGHEKETVVQERKKLPEADGSEETALLNS
ncbi:integrase catalytic domain-containing protein, partial [Trichonephila clavipes]